MNSDSIYKDLNPAQQEATQNFYGPCLILAGAGSGKTKVIVHRIAGLVSKKKIRPENILAVTFTNKAARELRERTNRLLKEVGIFMGYTTMDWNLSLCLRSNPKKPSPPLSKTQYFHNL